MAQDYTTYLAEQVLNEQQSVSYRLLSRVLKVHSNVAKQMLYEFHRKQNDKKPSSVHATYIITGTKIPTSAQNSQKEDDDGDSVMQSSPPLPFPSSSAAIPEETEKIAIHTMMLVKEEHLEHVKSLFSTITCIHVYALTAKGLSQVQTLAECNRKVAVAQAGEDPLAAWKSYGTIQNGSVRRRTTRGPPAPIVAPVAKPVIKAAPAPKLTTEKSTSRETPVSASVQKTATDLSKAAITKSSTPAPSKASASSLFKSFAKTAPVAKKPPPALSKNDSQASAASVQDTNMTGFSDDDDADDASLPEELFATNDSQGETGGKSKRDREAELQAMMDQEDEEDAKEKADEDGDDGDAQMDDIDSLPAAKEADEPVPDAEEEEPKVVVSNGRRRGKRRVPKKRTVRDEEGYLVTKEELAWESFSEEDIAPAAAKKAKTASTAAANKAPSSTKRSAGEKGKAGNIMSFFGKK